MIHQGALVKPVVTRFSKFVFAYQNSQNYRYRNSLINRSIEEKYAKCMQKQITGWTYCLTLLM